MVKFKSRKKKRKILIDRKSLCNKSENLSQLKFVGKLFISEKMYQESHQLTYKCRQFKNTGTIHQNNVLNVKFNERSQPAKIYRVVDIEKLFCVDNLNNFINNTSF